MVSYADSQALFQLVLNPGSNFSRDATRIVMRACLPPWPSQDANGRVYLNPGHSGLGEAGVGKWLTSTRQRPVFTIADLIPLTHPEYCRAGERERHAARMEMVLRDGAGVLSISQDTLDHLHAFADARNLPLPPCAVAPIAPAALRFDASLPRPVAPAYFVVVGTIEPRKNHLLLLHIWRDLIAELGDKAPHLVVIGQRGWECENVVDLLERCDALRGFVHEKTSCSDAELAQYVGHAQALLFPSFAEGYGMPLVEALMLGTPVVATDLPAFRETAGDVPEYLHPMDGPAWTQAVRDYARPHSERRAAQMSRLADWSAPTWPDHFEHVEALLERLG